MIGGRKVAFLLAALAAIPAIAQERSQVSAGFEGGAVKEDGLRWVVPVDLDGTATVVEKAGRTAFFLGPDEGFWPEQNLYFDVSDDFLLGDGTTPTPVWVKVDYLDVGTDTLTLEYDSTNPNGGPGGGAYTPIGSPPTPVRKTDSGEWKSKIWAIADANFANRQNGNTDFRVNDMGDGDEWISSVVVSLEELKLDNAGTLSGIVADSDGKPLPGVQVAAGGEAAVTDAQGRYSLMLPAGKYPVRAFIVGYRPGESEETIAGGATTTRDYTLAADTRQWVALSARGIDDGVRWSQRTGGDGDATVETIGVGPAFRTGPDIEPFADAYLYGDVADSFLFGGKPVTDAWLVVEYLDAGTDTFSVHYDAGDFPFSYAETDPVTKTDTGEWKSVTIPLANVSFGNRQNGGSDFRIWDRDDGDETIRRVWVYTVDPATLPPIQLGDMNRDGKVNVQDATISLRQAVGLVRTTELEFITGDANNDGKLNIQDTTLILQVAVGNRPGF